MQVRRLGVGNPQSREQNLAYRNTTPPSRASGQGQEVKHTRVELMSATVEGDWRESHEGEGGSDEDDAEADVKSESSSKGVNEQGCKSRVEPIDLD